MAGLVQQHADDLADDRILARDALGVVAFGAVSSHFGDIFVAEHDLDSTGL